MNAAVALKEERKEFPKRLGNSKERERRNKDWGIASFDALVSCPGFPPFIHTRSKKMRIVAGKFRSRLIQAPKGDQTRPTLDKVKEADVNQLIYIIIHFCS